MTEKFPHPVAAKWGITKTTMKAKQKLIYTSTDYNKFEKDPDNRTPGDNPRLRASMANYGWLDAYPANVIVRGGKFIIKDGQHRAIYAQEMGIPIKYVVGDNDEISTPDVNCGRQWGLANYVSSYQNKGKRDYVALSLFQNETGLPLSACIAMLAGVGQSGGQTQLIRAGKFKVGNTDHAYQVLSVLKCAQEMKFKWWKHTHFVFAVNSILLYTKADPKVLCNKIRSHACKLLPQASTEDFIAMLEQIYNYHSRTSEQIAISLAVKQAIRERINATK